MSDATRRTRARLGDTGHTTTRIQLPSMTLRADYRCRGEVVKGAYRAMFEGLQPDLVQNPNGVPELPKQQPSFFG